MRDSGFLNRQTIRSIITRSYPMGQFEQPRDTAADQGDLGFGFIYYALSRVLKPDQVVVVGSYRGFSVVCTALGLVHNRKGRLHFVDAAVVDDFWTNPARARRHFRTLGVDSRVTLHQTTTQQWLARDRKAHAGQPFIDLLLLDGDHSFRGASFDYRKLGRLVRAGGYILLHDSFVGGVGKTEWAVADFLGTLDIDLFEALTFEVAQGLTIIKKLPGRFIPRSRTATRRRLQAHLAQVTRSQNGRRRAGLLDVQRELRRLLADSADLDRILEMRSRFLLKSNSDLRRRNRLLKIENQRLRSLTQRPLRSPPRS
jgi:predicted O-methyltransferase YrrM